jgi:D-glycero-D-manno-heptose 1,7-bisphosphate phosphatase
MPLQAGVFLDRDGTVIEERHFLSEPNDVVLLPTAGESIAHLNSLGIGVAVVTNQSGIARGYFPESRIAEVHARLDELLQGFQARIDRYEYCPHHPDEGVGIYRIDCDCRKPKPGMLIRSAAALHLDPARSLMVGDRLGDLQAGANAGCTTALVRTGYGQSVVMDFDPTALRLIGVFDTLGDAINAWMQRTR